MRCGSKQHNKIEMPANANIFTSPMGRPAYVSAVYNNLGSWMILIRFTDGLKPETKKIPYTDKYF